MSNVGRSEYIRRMLAAMCSVTIVFDPRLARDTGSGCPSVGGQRTGGSVRAGAGRRAVRMSGRVTSRSACCRLGGPFEISVLLPSAASCVDAERYRAPNPAVEQTVNGGPCLLASSVSAAPLPAAHLQR